MLHRTHKKKCTDPACYMFYDCGGFDQKHSEEDDD